MLLIPARRRKRASAASTNGELWDEGGGSQSDHRERSEQSDVGTLSRRWVG
jgi:hypothetical protein